MLSMVLIKSDILGKITQLSQLNTDMQIENFLCTMGSFRVSLEPIVSCLNETLQQTLGLPMELFHSPIEQEK